MTMAPLSNWATFGNRVVDLSRLMKRHPGSRYLLMRSVGRDISLYFRGHETIAPSIPKHKHSPQALQALYQNIRGILVHESSAKGLKVCGCGGFAVLLCSVALATVCRLAA